MNCGKPAVAACLTLLALPGLAGFAAAQAPGVELKIVARFLPEEGNISDAALLDNGHLALLYPEAGRIADYHLNGMLNQHVVREGGVESRFRPVCGVAGPSNMLYVFDEATASVYTIGTDGNIHRGVNLSYPLDGGGSTVLSRIGDLWVDSAGGLWAVLPERGILAAFRRDGSFLSQTDLRARISEPQAAFSRIQFGGDNSLYTLDYHQGAVYRFLPGTEQARRIVVEEVPGVDALPTVQDFAADPGGRLLITTYIEQRPVLLLLPAGDRYRLHPISLDLPEGAGRLACRYSGGKFIVWSRETPFVIVLQLD